MAETCSEVKQKVECHKLRVEVDKLRKALEKSNARACDLEEALEESDRRYLTLFLQVHAGNQVDAVDRLLKAHKGVKQRKALFDSLRANNFNAESLAASNRARTRHTTEPPLAPPSPLLLPPSVAPVTQSPVTTLLHSQRFQRSIARVQGPAAQQLVLLEQERLIEDLRRQLQMAHEHTVTAPTVDTRGTQTHSPPPPSPPPALDPPATAPARPRRQRRSNGNLRESHSAPSLLQQLDGAAEMPVEPTSPSMEKTCVVRSRSSITKNTTVLEKDSLLWWEFSTARFDIAFGLTFHPVNANDVPLTVDSTLSKYFLNLTEQPATGDSLSDSKVTDGQLEASEDTFLIAHLKHLLRSHAGAFGLSYRNVKERLINEFGPDAFQKNKELVSSIMENVMRQRHPKRHAAPTTIVVQSPRRVKAHHVPQRGVVRVPCAGHFEFVWDNSYSKMRKKTLSYRYHVGDAAALGQWMGGRMTRPIRQRLGQLVRSTPSRERSATASSPTPLPMEFGARNRSKTESLNSEYSTLSAISAAQPIPLPDHRRVQSAPSKPASPVVAFSMTVCKNLFEDGSGETRLMPESEADPLDRASSHYGGMQPFQNLNWAPSRPNGAEGGYYLGDDYGDESDIDEAEL